MTEIITGAARTEAPGAEEPRLTLTELQNLLRAAAALERAQRPINIHPSTQAPVTALPTDPAHRAPEFGGRHPSPAEAAGIVEMAPLRHPAPPRRTWGVPLAVASMGVLVAGAATGAVLGTAAGPVGMCAGGIAGAIAGTARAVHEQNREQ